MLQASALELSSTARSSPFSSGFASLGASWGTGVAGKAEAKGKVGSTLAGVTDVVWCSRDESSHWEVLEPILRLIPSSSLDSSRMRARSAYSTTCLSHL
jgi:hypothetical protein